MDVLFGETSVLIHELKCDLTNYEGCLEPVAEGNFYQTAVNKIQRLFEICERLDILVNKETGQQRGSLRQRVNEIKYDLKHYQTALSNISQKKQQRLKEEEFRRSLINRNINSYSTNSSNGETALNLDHSIHYSGQLDTAHSLVDSIIQQATVSLSSLKNQGLSLKNIHRKVISMGNVLGLSSTVIHSIERRTAGDWWILFGGMIVTLIVMFIVYKMFV